MPKVTSRKRASFSATPVRSTPACLPSGTATCMYPCLPRTAPRPRPRRRVLVGPSATNQMAGPTDAAVPQPGIRVQGDQDPPRPSLPAHSHPQQPQSSAVADGGPASASRSGAVSPEPLAHPEAVAPAADKSGQAASNPARWPAPDPRTSGQNQQSTAQARPDPDTGRPSSGRQHQSSTTAQPEQVNSRSAQPWTAPEADWRDQILHQARQPQHPSPSWPYSPALRHMPEPDAPEAGLEPGR